MRAFARFVAYLAAQPGGNREIIAALRQFVNRVAPRLSAAVKWRNGCWVSGNSPVAYVCSARGYVQFGFFRGSGLNDPKGLLQGQGKYVRLGGDMTASPTAACLAVNLAYTFGAAVLGGWVAGLVAKRQELLHGAAMAALMLLLSLGGGGGGQPDAASGVPGW